MDTNFLKFSDNKIRKKVEAIIIDQKLKEKQKSEKITSLIIETLTLGKKLSESFIREIHQYLEGYYFAQFQNLSLDFIRQFQNKKLYGYNWINVIKCNNNIDIHFYEQFKQKLNWVEVSRVPFRFPLDFLQRNKEKVDWFWLSNNINLTEQFIDKFADQDLDWQYITNNFDLTEQFIDKYCTKLNMCNIIYDKRFKFSNKFKQNHPLYFL